VPVVESDTVVAIIGTSHEITDYKQREQVLKNLTERFELVTEGANLGIWDWHADEEQVTYDDGAPTRAVGVHINIDDRKRSEQQLKREARGPAVVITWGLEEGWPITYASDNITEHFGYAPRVL